MFHKMFRFSRGFHSVEGEKFHLSKYLLEEIEWLSLYKPGFLKNGMQALLEQRLASSLALFDSLILMPCFPATCNCPYSQITPGCFLSQCLYFSTLHFLGCPVPHCSYAKTNDQKINPFSKTYFQHHWLVQDLSCFNPVVFLLIPCKYPEYYNNYIVLHSFLCTCFSPGSLKAGIPWLVSSNALAQLQV